MRLFKECPLCGGDVVEKRVEKLLRGGKNVATITVNAEVCLHCGERLYSPNIIKKFEQIRKNLSKGELKKFKTVGKAVEVS